MGEGDRPKSDGEIFFASEYNQLYYSTWYKLTTSTPGDPDGGGLLKFSATTWSSAAARTTDSGSSWSGSGFVDDHLAASSGANGISIDQDDTTDSLYTSDSGANWNASTTDPDLDGGVNQVAISGSVAVCGGNDTTNRSIYYSSDGGNNWAECSTGPTDEVTAICLASSTIGYALDSSSNIWKTTDGGDNWTDTTDNFSLQPKSFFAIDTDTVLGLADEGNLKVGLYVNSTNTTTTLIDDEGGDSLSKISNVVTATNGNHYWVRGYQHVNGETNTIMLYRFDGTDVFVRHIMTGMIDDADKYLGIDGVVNITFPSLIEVSNVLYLNAYNHILEINVTGD